VSDIILFFTFIRPFISSLAFPYANFIFSAFLFMLLLAWLLRNSKTLRLTKYLALPLSVFILSIAISLILSQDKSISIGESYKYATGILLFLVGASFSCKYRNRAIFWLVASGLIISLLSIYQYILGFQHLTSYIAEQNISSSFILDYIAQKRTFFPFVTPNALGGYLAMVLPLTLTIGPLIWLAIPLSMALFLTKSLGALISLLGGLLIFFYMRGGIKKRRLFVLLAVLTIIISIFITRSAIEKKQFTPTFSALTRWDYWMETIKIIEKHPLNGVGIGNFNLPSSRYTHNSYLQILAETGILGLASFLWLVISVLRRGFKKIKDSGDKQLAGLLSLCCIFLFHNAVDFSFFLPEINTIWWLALGILSSYLSADQPDKLISFS